jgi:hypothetical protein
MGKIAEKPSSHRTKASFDNPGKRLGREFGHGQ